ncbi:hypothetical protein B566_EDAN007616 [Ephemera danica]|nr:hypothetical protein B566_EDAN007616 [Ephemera danica]
MFDRGHNTDHKYYNQVKMATSRKNLSQLCKENDIFGEMRAMKNIENEAVKQFQNISQGALQWLEELKEQQKTNPSEVRGPLLPQTPTMKRKMRKRKLPPVDEKENSAAVTRSRRAASQAANLKFHDQLNIHVSKKMRRPSSPKTTVETTVDSSMDTKQNGRPQRGQKRLRVRLEVTTDEEEDVPNESATSEATIDPTIIAAQESVVAETGKRTKHKKFKVMPPQAENETDSDNAKQVKTSSKTIKSRLRNREKHSIEQDLQVKDQTTQNLSEQIKNTDLVTINIKQEKLSTVLDSNKELPCEIESTRELTVTVARLTQRITSTVRVTPKGTFVFFDEQPKINNAVEDVDESDAPLVANETVDLENESIAKSTKSPDKKKLELPKSQKESDKNVAGVRQGELLALTPHLKGIVKERVEAVEKSLKKDEPVSKVIASKEKQVETPGPSKSCTHPASGASSDPFESAESIVEEPSPTLSFAPLSDATTSTVSRNLVVKLFPEETMRKRSKSVDQNLSSMGKAPSSTLPRSRVLTGLRTFIKPSAKEVAAAAAVEEEKKRKAEEMQRNLERVQDAAKKKEEQLRLKKEQKKKENDEKRARALLAQEAKAREQEEAARLEKERDERKALLQKQREEKELAEKEARKELKKQKQAEREQRRKDDEALRKAKANEIAHLAAQEKARRDEEHKADLAKGGWATAPTAKTANLTKATAPHPHNLHSKATATVPVKHVQMNETFEMPNKPTADSKTTATQAKAPAPAAIPRPVMHHTVASNSYNLTPLKGEAKPLPPKNANDYGIDEVEEDDPSDDDEKPKKKIPFWARNLRANPSLECADYVSIGLRNRLFGTKVFKPSAQELFGASARTIHRRSSAIWNTPPNVHHMSMCSSFIEGH